MPAKRSTKPAPPEDIPAAAPQPAMAQTPLISPIAPTGNSAVVANKRGRKVDETLPQSHQRNVQRQFRARRANHLLELERRVALLERENSILRHWCNLHPAPRYLLGRGPTGCDTSKPLIAEEDDPEICLMPLDPASSQAHPAGPAPIPGPPPTDMHHSPPTQIHPPSRPPPAAVHIQQHTPAPSLSPVEIHAPRYESSNAPAAPPSIMAPNSMVMHPGEPVYHHDGRLAYPTAPHTSAHSYLDSFASHALPRPSTANNECPPLQDHSYGLSQPLRHRQSLSTFPQYGLLEGYTA